MYLVLAVQFAPTGKEGCVEQLLRQRCVNVHQAHASPQSVGWRLPHELHGEALHPLDPIIPSRSLRYFPCLFQMMLVYDHSRGFSWRGIFCDLVLSMWRNKCAVQMMYVRNLQKVGRANIVRKSLTAEKLLD